MTEKLPSEASSSEVGYGVVRPMLLPGVEVSAIEAAKYDEATPQEEADFQQALARIREAERQAAIEGQRIILGESSSE